MQQSKYWHSALRFTLLYVLLVVLMSLAKPLFMFAQPADVAGTFTSHDVWQVMVHGLPHDLATAGYLIAPIWLLTGIAVWIRIKAWRIAYRVYTIVVAMALAMIYVGDACLYSFWHTKLDATVWTYLAQPQGITQSVSMGYALCAVLATLASAILLYYILTWAYIPRKQEKRVAYGATSVLHFAQNSVVGSLDSGRRTPIYRHTRRSGQEHSQCGYGVLQHECFSEPCSRKSSL